MEEKKKINLKNKKDVKKKLHSSIKTPNKKKKIVEKKSAKKKKVVTKPKEKEEVAKLIENKKRVTKKITPKKEAKKVEKNKKQNNKTELVLPKEWQKLTSTKKKPSNLKARLQDTMFEELLIEEAEEKKKEEKIKYTKRGIYFIVFVIGIVSLLMLIDYLKITNARSFFKYVEYKTGQRIRLKDGSFWYVVDNSLGNNNKVILLKETIVDINNDDKIDNNDKIRFNTNAKNEYDIKSKDSVGEYLEKEYKKKLNNKIGNVIEIRLLKSREFVKMREELGFPFEWKTENILAGKTLGVWWIEGVNKDSVYAVTIRGVYKLYKPGDYNYIRPVIVIDKDLI